MREPLRTRTAFATLAQQISDDDAKAMVEAGLQGEPDISAEAGETLAEILLC